MPESRTVTRAVQTPATALFLPLIERGEWEPAVEVLDRHWVEIWYAVDPAELRSLLGEVPASLLSRLKNANYIARVTGHGVIEDLRQPELPSNRAATLSDIAQLVADLRLRERPELAMTYVRRGAEMYRALRGQLVDGTGGEGALWLLQAATTALLAGDAAAAQGMLLSAVNTHLPARFPFVVRDVTAKRALALAVAGDVAEARHVIDHAQALARTDSWVESLVDDTLWLADFICAVDSLDPRAEEMRIAHPSPMAHLEFWPVALAAHVRHLTLTGRPHVAEELCDAVVATGMPASDADGLFASAVPDARLSTRRHGTATPTLPGASPAQAELSRALHLFVTGQFAAVTLLTLPATHDDRLVRAMALLQAQATVAKGRVEEGRQQLLETLREVLTRRTYSTLRYLTADTLRSVADTEEGACAGELVERHRLPTVEVRAVLVAPLTEAEIDVLHLLREGLTREEMARRLFVSVNTVKTQLRSAYQKLGASSRVEALTTFSRLGI